MKALSSVLLASAILAGCAAIAEPVGIEKGAINQPGKAGPVYVSVEPRETQWFDRETAAGIKRFYWRDLTNAEVNSNLTLERSFVSVLKKDASANVGFVSAKYSGSAGQYRTILDYGKFRDDVMGENKTPVRVGVGVRIIADITTLKSDVDLGSIFAIAFAAKAGYLTGQIEVIKIGIDAPSLNLILPPPTDINDSSLQNALQAVASIRSKLYDQTTQLTPYILAMQK
jgi:hypothetical protein